MLWIRKLHYRVHKSPCFVPIPSQKNRVTLSHFLWSITILPSHLLLALSSGHFLHFSTPKPWIYFYSPPCMLHTPSTSDVLHFITIRGQPLANVDLLMKASPTCTVYDCKQKAAVVKTGQKGTTAGDYNTIHPRQVVLQSTHDANEYRHVWATRESLNVAMTPLLPLPHNDVRHDTYRHFIQGTTEIRDGILIQRNSWVTQCAVF